ncbi:MAG: hypothetical protein M3Y08_18205 [Fibrobacterota bacterium]|nr:hypothetical protein [Fibrobacterota bacterium]
MYGNVIAMIGFSITINPAAVATITTAEQSFTVPGLRVNDWVYLSKPTNTAGVGVVNCRVSAADTLAVTFVNPTAASVDAASETYQGLMVRFDALRVGNAAA